MTCADGDTLGDADKMIDTGTRYRPESTRLKMTERKKEIPFLENQQQIKIHQDPIFYSLWWSLLYSGSPEY